MKVLRKKATDTTMPKATDEVEGLLTTLIKSFSREYWNINLILASVLAGSKGGSSKTINKRKWKNQFNSKISNDQGHVNL